MNLTSNKEVKMHAKNSKICLWRVAEEMGMRDSEFSRWLRHELSEEDRGRVMQTIDRLAAEEGRA